MNRIAMLERIREEERRAFDEKKKEIQQKAKAGVEAIGLKFATNSDNVEEQLKQQTIGLVSFEEFKKKREVLERQAQEKLERDKQA